MGPFGNTIIMIFFFFFLSVSFVPYTVSRNSTDAYAPLIVTSQPFLLFTQIRTPYRQVTYMTAINKKT